MKPDQTRPIVILVTHDGMGKADPELSHKLIATHFRLLDGNDYLPNAICFYAEGVKLVLRG